jgi:hypothetical protein
MSEIRRAEFERMPLRVHSFLAGVPQRTLYRLDLPGGREGMKLRDIDEVVGFSGEDEFETGVVTRTLFGLRGLIGAIFGWDDVPALDESVTYRARLSEEDRRRSLVEPGTVMGISRVLYYFDNELLAEIVNRTVHCFWMMASERSATGYTLYLAIFVRKINWFTPIYMALITPLLKWIIYPSMMKGIKRRWERAFDDEGIKRRWERAFDDEGHQTAMGAGLR